MSQKTKEESLEHALNIAEQDLQIDPENLTDELLDQPLFYRKWGRLKSEASKHAKVLAIHLEALEAERHLHYSKASEKAKVKDVESMVASDPAVIELKEQLAEAENLFEEFDNILRAFHQRHESIKELCANIRKEFT